MVNLCAAVRRFWIPCALLILQNEEQSASGKSELGIRAWHHVLLTHDNSTVTLFVHGSRDDPFLKKLRQRLQADIDKSEQVMVPFKLSFTQKVKGMVGKYVW